ncbi:unnamed protein product [Oppiella nova]|uniref:Uncharacterized protein n=1 Tax=Oppiella nova TaxID=334625 RepID=A0A7R9M3W0_9ACAR|nr:unnamed protein product [Oppiella nova]CAG2170235.1 unnamed protein product [Oppiella nova]
MSFAYILWSVVSLLAVVSGKQSVPKLPKATDLLFGQLGHTSQYPIIASCFGQIHENMTDCNLKAEQRTMVMEKGNNLEADNEWTRSVKCCDIWRLRDCYVSYGQRHVTWMPYVRTTHLSRATGPTWGFLVLGVICG